MAGLDMGSCEFWLHRRVCIITEGEGEGEIINLWEKAVGEYEEEEEGDKEGKKERRIRRMKFTPSFSCTFQYLSNRM